MTSFRNGEPARVSIGSVSNLDRLEKERSNQDVMLDHVTGLLKQTSLDGSNLYTVDSTRIIEVLGDDLQLDFDHDFDGEEAMDKFDPQGNGTLRSSMASYRPTSSEWHNSFQDSANAISIMSGEDLAKALTSGPQTETVPQLSALSVGKSLLSGGFDMDDMDSHGAELAFSGSVSVASSVSSSAHSINARMQEVVPMTTFSNSVDTEQRRKGFADRDDPSNVNIEFSPRKMQVDQVESESFKLRKSRVYIEGEPTKLDVLLGRGGGTNRHPGNIRYREEVEKVKPIYKRIAQKQSKTNFSDVLKEHVHQYGGRFLEKDRQGRWFVADPKRARRKCSQALREDNKEKRKIRNEELKKQRSEMKMQKAASKKQMIAAKKERKAALKRERSEKKAAARMEKKGKLGSRKNMQFAVGSNGTP